MLIKLFDNSLIRRFGKSIIDVDSGIGRSLIYKGLGKAIESKIKLEPEENKMIGGPIISKIFPETIIKGDLK